jgi:hypothetical protein
MNLQLSKAITSRYASDLCKEGNDGFQMVAQM